MPSSQQGPVGDSAETTVGSRPVRVGRRVARHRWYALPDRTRRAVLAASLEGRAHPDRAVSCIAANYAHAELVWMRRCAIGLLAALPIVVLLAALQRGLAPTVPPLFGLPCTGASSGLPFAGAGLRLGLGRLLTAELAARGMPGRIDVVDWIVAGVAVPVEILRVGKIRHDGVRDANPRGQRVLRAAWCRR